MNIAFFETNKEEESRLRSELKGNCLHFSSFPLTRANCISVSNCEIISTFIHSKITAELIRKLPALRYIVTRSMGFDHINLEACKKAGIKVLNAPHYGDNAVAEHTFGLLLSLSRNISRASLRNVHGDHSLKGLQGFDLKGKVLGVIGAGRIGSHVIQIARGFEMKVLVYDPQHAKNTGNHGLTYVSLHSLLQNADIITLHIPYNKQNHHFLDRDKFKLMKRGVIVINTSRGGVIDTRALLSFLHKGLIGGIGLDVIEGEDLLREEKGPLHTKKLNRTTHNQLLLARKLIGHKNVVFTPHIAFYSREAVDAIHAITLRNINSAIRNKPINTVFS